MIRHIPTRPKPSRGAAGRIERLGAVDRRRLTIPVIAPPQPRAPLADPTIKPMRQISDGHLGPFDGCFIPWAARLSGRPRVRAQIARRCVQLRRQRSPIVATASENRKARSDGRRADPAAMPGMKIALGHHGCWRPRDLRFSQVLESELAVTVPAPSQAPGRARVGCDARCGGCRFASRSSRCFPRAQPAGRR